MTRILHSTSIHEAKYCDFSVCDHPFLFVDSVLNYYYKVRINEPLSTKVAPLYMITERQRLKLLYREN